MSKPSGFVKQSRLTPMLIAGPIAGPITEPITGSAFARSPAPAPQADYAFLILDPQGRIVCFSADAAQLLGGDAQSLLGQTLNEYIPAIPLSAATRGCNLADSEFRSGNPHWQVVQATHAAIEIRTQRLAMVDQAYIAMELRALRLNSPEEALEKLIKSSEQRSEIVVITDTQGQMTYVNRAFVQFTGYRREEALGRTHDLLDADQAPENYARMWGTLRAGKPFTGVFVNRHKNGQLFHEERTARPFIDAQGKITHYIFQGRDVSDRERVMQRLQHLANHDGLTGLPNRNLFMDRLRQAMTHAARRNNGFSLLLLDLDHFKAVNDRFGHAAGDAVLIAVASRLKHCVREEDTVARLGGDEFAIILSDTAHPEEALIVLEKIVEALHQPFMLEGYQLPVNASIGVAIYPEDSVGVETLLKFADIAMYRAKNGGGNSYHFHRQRGKAVTQAARADAQQRQNLVA